MSTKTWIVPTCLSLAALGLVGWQVKQRGAREELALQIASDNSRALDALGSKLIALSARAEQNEARLAELAARPTLSSGGEARVSSDAIAAAVGLWMQEHAAQAAQVGTQPAAAPTASKPSAAAIDLAASIQQLLDPKLNELERDEIWKKLKDAGKLDEAVAWFEQQVEQRPNDPDAQVDLGTAYVQKIMESGGGPLAGKWAMKADGAWDRALEIDERHWEARFRKAVGLSFWPPVFGKQGEAIKHFETLLAQQEENGSAQSHYVETYKLLGNMYAQSGQQDKALAAWKKGLASFPNDPDLLAKLPGAK
jgi:tetratricopeptide (TPR) repeat protein